MTVRYLIVSLLLMTLTGCAARQLPPSAPLNPQAPIETLASSVALSIKAGDKGLSGRGYLVIRYPDQFRLVMLTPFGTTVAELFINGDDLLYIASSDNLAYQGKLADLPDNPALQSWRLLRWVMEPVSGEPGERQLARVTPEGALERVDFDDNGLVVRKRIDGDEVNYGEYLSFQGVAVPQVITITDRQGITVRISLDEPEVNGPLDAASFSPALEGVTVLPLSQFPKS